MSAVPQDEGERDRLTEAREFLRDVLRAGPEETKRIKAEATEADIAWRTVERAKASLKVQAYKEREASRRWMWTLSGPSEEGDEDRGEAESADSSARRWDDGGLGGDGGLPS